MYALPECVLCRFLSQRFWAVALLVLYYRKQDALEILKDYGRNLITPGTVARILGMMAQTHTGLPESVPYLVREGERGSVWERCIFWAKKRSRTDNDWKRTRREADMITPCLGCTQGVTGDSSRMQAKSPATWDAKVFATALQALVSVHALFYNWDIWGRESVLLRVVNAHVPQSSIYSVCIFQRQEECYYALFICNLQVSSCSGFCTFSDGFVVSDRYPTSVGVMLFLSWTTMDSTYPVPRVLASSWLLLMPAVGIPFLLKWSTVPGSTARGRCVCIVCMSALASLTRGLNVESHVKVQVSLIPCCVEL